MPDTGLLRAPAPLCSSRPLAIGSGNGNGSGINTPLPARCPPRQHRRTDAAPQPRRPRQLPARHAPQPLFPLPQHGHRAHQCSEPAFTPGKRAQLQLQRVARAKCCGGHQPVRLAGQHARVLARRPPLRELQQQQLVQQRQLACVEAVWNKI
ncbi:hypothetical protein C8J57DRAFT_1725226 [Mycena rebaudengoi]|nr:hypothetical protein C8J57DRAFT_1725226 [Mycena rebaudengoi]